MGLMPTSLPPALEAERIEFDSPAGRLSLYVAGPADRRPVLLLHSVNAAASAAEVRPVFEHARRHRPVVALDLPGYGFSERSRRAYTPRLMTDAVHATLAWMDRHFPAHTPRPADALALSLSCEFLARAADEQPHTLRRLALVSPTGFNGRRRRRGAPGSTLGLPWLHRLLSSRALGGPLFRQLTRPSVVRYFLRRTFGNQKIDERLWRDAVATACQSGAEHAPLHFLSAGLFSADINDLYERLTHPVWMSHGVRGDFTDYRGVDTVQGRPNWRFSVFQTGAMPYFEEEAAFGHALDDWLGLA
jgi:pimeloyl-ACP methyl ester carboxylesterase